MTILNILYNQKTHIIYGLIILGIIAGAYSLFVTHPKTITKTEVVTKVVNKTQVVHDHITTTKYITLKKKDGSVLTEKIVSKDTSLINSSSTSNFSETKTETRTNQSKYSLSIIQPFEYNQLLTGTPNPANMEIIGGVRLFNSPILLQIGTTPLFNKVFTGVTVEF